MIYKKLAVKKAKKQRGLFADEEIKKGEKIVDFPGRIVTEKETDTWDLQIGKNRFIKAPENSIDRFINHSCEPNSFVKQTGKKFYLVAIQNIERGEEITFDYDTTDYDNEKFRLFCSCKSKNCRKSIRGFKYLNARQKKRLETYLVPYLKRIFEKEKTGKKSFSG